MMPLPALLPALLGAKTFVATWWKLGVGMVMGALMCFPLAYCEGKKAAGAQYKAARAEANVEAMKRGAAANEKAAEQRAKDATEITAKEKELIDAIESTPDTAPDTVRVKLGCQQLRAQGTDTSTIPACR